jgi:hypothetical protein
MNMKEILSETHVKIKRTTLLHYKHTLENTQASVVKDSTYSTKSVLLIPCPGGYISSIGSGEVSFHTYSPSK